MTLAPTRIAHALALLAAGASLAAGCGGKGTAAPGSGAAASTPASSQGGDAAAWADRANAICTAALPDRSHALVAHFDTRHIRRHGMTIVVAGSQLDELGPPADADAHAYARMIELYKRSAIYHGLALRDLAEGNDGNAVGEYSIGLDMADRADRMAVGFGATACNRFGLEG